MLSPQSRLAFSVGVISIVLIVASYPIWASTILGILGAWFLFSLPIGIAVGHLVLDDRQQLISATNNGSLGHTDNPSVYPDDFYDDEDCQMYNANTNENPRPALFQTGTPPDRRRPVDIFIGQRIAQRRVAVQLSLDGLATEASIPSDRMASYEKGEQRVIPHHLFEIGRTLGVGVGYFFDTNKITSSRQ